MITILQGDAVEQLRTLPDKSVQCCVTSPPYFGLRDYGIDGQIGMEETPELFVAKIVEVFREVRRVLRDDGTLWLNFGDSHASGKGTCYNPGGGEESLGQDRKEAGCHPLDRGNKSTLAQSGLKPKDMIGIPWMVAFALRADGWYLRSDIIWSKLNPMPESVSDRPTKSHEYLFLLTKNARYYYDADAIREPSSCSDPTSVSYRKNGKSDSRKKHTPYCLSCNGSGDGVDGEYGDPCEVCGGTGKSQIGKVKCAVKNEGFWQPDPAGRNRRTVWSIPTKPFKGAHFAVFPEALVDPCIKAGTSERGCCSKCGAPWKRVVERTPNPSKEFNIGNDMTGGAAKTGNPQTSKGLHRNNGNAQGEPPKTTGWQPTCKCNADTVPCVVLDPFGGSGTTAKVATKLNRDCILIELNHDYIRIAKKKNGLAPLPKWYAHSLGYDIKVMKHEVW